MLRRSILLRLAPLLAVPACASEPPQESPGPRIRAEILTAGRIRMDGKEITTDGFLEAVRQRVADAGGDEARMPAVLLIATETVRHTSVPARVFEALRDTGVRYIDLEVDW